MPLTRDGRVAMIEREWLLVSVDLQMNGQIRGSIGKAVEVTRNRFASRPAGHANFHREGAGSLRVHGDFDGAVPGIASLLRDADLAVGIHLDLGLITHKEINVERIPLLRVHVAGYGRRESCDIAGTAGDPKPGTALMLTIRFERIGIEVGLTIERNARDQAIVEGSLED